MVAREKESVDNAAADCAYGVWNKKKRPKHTHTRDTKPIYAAEGYQKERSNGDSIESNASRKKAARQLQQQRKSWNVFQKVASVRRPRSPSSSSSSLWFFRHSVCICRKTRRKISKYLLCATRMHWAQRNTCNYFQVDPFFALRFAWILFFQWNNRQQQQQSKQKIGYFGRYISVLCVSPIYTQVWRAPHRFQCVDIHFICPYGVWSTAIYEFDSSINGGDSDGRNK